MSYTGRVHSLSAPSRYWNRIADNSEFNRVVTVISRRLLAGEPIYVRFFDPRRKGSVGKITSVDIRDVSNWYAGYGGNTKHYQLNNIEVKWDGRSNKVHPYDSEIEFLEDWEGGTVWAYSKPSPAPAKPIPVVKDHLGAEVEPGDFVSFVSRRYGEVKLHFGNVSRINHNGTVWVNTLKLRDDDQPQEVKVHDPDTIVKQGKDLMDRLILARMSAQ